jgi:hypothetical protein
MRSRLDFKVAFGDLCLTLLIVISSIGSIVRSQDFDASYDSLAPANDLSINYGSDQSMHVPSPNEDFPVDTFDALDPELSVNPLTRLNHSAYAASLGPLDASFGNDLTLDSAGSPYPSATYQLQQCYNASGFPQYCKPAFENAAYHKPIEATNTCGDRGPIRFCQIAGQLAQTNCSVCVKGQHPPTAMNDNDNHTLTWWQSETMQQDIQYPNLVNITLRLGAQQVLFLFPFRVS